MSLIDTIAPFDNTGVQPKVLVVDDKPENHRPIAATLEPLDTIIYYACSGEEALALTLRHDFAVILLDVMMPEMDGFETASLLHINDKTRHTPIIFITAMDASEEYESRGYQVGAVDYMFKPFKSETLVSKVSVFLELESQRRRLKRTLEDVHLLQERNQLLLDSIGEGILGVSPEGDITFCNPAAETTLGYKRESLLSNKIDNILYSGNSDRLNILWQDTLAYQKCSQGLRYHESIGVFWNSDNALFSVEYIASPLFDKGQFSGVVIAFQDITERRETEEQLAQLAQYDTLTGLINRHAFGNQLEQAISRRQRDHSTLTLIFLDLDKFKQVNDNLGHEVGDSLLKKVAVRLQKCIRGGDLISRLGGDEFTIVIENTHSSRDAAAVAEKIITCLEPPFDIHGHQVHIGASIGIALCPQSAEDSATLMRCADIAMYKAKEEGRNKYRFFTDAMQQEVQYTVALENQLRGALKRDEFLLYYQPKIDLTSGTLVGYEALIRWQPDADEIISPDQFIPKAEEMGLIIAIGEWVFHQACLQLKQWHQEDPSLTVAVNLSMRQLLDPELPKRLANSLSETGVAASNVEVEVTESMVMEDSTLAIRSLNALHQLGLRISIDDFGTGYSSLSHLRQLPLDALKVDQSFTQEIGQHAESGTIVKAVISLAHNLGLKVIAEGVETEEQLKFLRQHQCNQVQGFYFSPPLSADSITSLPQKFTIPSAAAHSLRKENKRKK